MTSCGWIWMYIGAFLMLAELLAPGFVIFFFGLSAATVGILRFAFGESFTLTWQLAAFSVLAIIYLAVLRRWLKGIFIGKTETTTTLEKEYVGRTGKVTAAIRPDVPGRVQIGDAEWSASSDMELSPGDDVKVVDQDNLTLKVTRV